MTKSGRVLSGKPVVFSIPIDFCIEFLNSTFSPVLEYTEIILLTASARAFQWCKHLMRNCFRFKVIQVFLAHINLDINTLYDGVTFQNSSSISGYTTIRSVIGCIACDLPATSKVCGFANFNANHGCKCMKTFTTTTFGSKPSYGGFNYDNWCIRDITTHRFIANKYLNSATALERKKILYESGVKISELLNIPYFDIVRCHVIDPMHNIFLGLAKLVIHTWKEVKIIQITHFAKIQEKIDSINLPPKVGPYLEN